MEALLIPLTAMQAVGAIQQGRAESAAAQSRANAEEYNAIVARQNAQVAGAQASAQEDQQRRKFRALQGEAITAAAQSGAGLDGSNADVLQQNAIANELDALTIRYEGQMKARGLMAQSELDMMNARASRRAAKDAMIGGYLNAGASILSGASKLYGGARSGGLAPVEIRDVRG